MLPPNIHPQVHVWVLHLQGNIGGAGLLRCPATFGRVWRISHARLRNSFLTATCTHNRMIPDIQGNINIAMVAPRLPANPNT